MYHVVPHELHFCFHSTSESADMYFSSVPLITYQSVRDRGDTALYLLYNKLKELSRDLSPITSTGLQRRSLTRVCIRWVSELRMRSPKSLVAGPRTLILSALMEPFANDREDSRSFAIQHPRGQGRKRHNRCYKDFQLNDCDITARCYLHFCHFSSSSCPSTPPIPLPSTHHRCYTHPSLHLSQPLQIPNPPENVKISILAAAFTLSCRLAWRQFLRACGSRCTATYLPQNRNLNTVQMQL